MMINEENKPNNNDDVNQNAENQNTEKNTEPKEKVTIEFPYSEFVRGKAPKVFEVAENVATEVTHQWKNNEKFENIGMPHPIAEVAAVKVLEKAKEVEKKLEEKGVISAAKMGVEIAKLQAQSILSKIKKS